MTWTDTSRIFTNIITSNPSKINEVHTSMAGAVHLTIGVLTLLIWLLGYIPFISLHLLRFYNFRGDITLSKRYPTITLITVISLVLWIVIFILEIVRFFFGGATILEDIFDFLNIIFNFIFACTILWRCWLSYYDIRFCIATSSREWQQFIKYDAQFKNWYFQKRKTYGDYTWTKKRFAIGTTLLIILFILMYAVTIYCFRNVANLRIIFVYIQFCARFFSAASFFVHIDSMDGDLIYLLQNA